MLLNVLSGVIFVERGRTRVTISGWVAVYWYYNVTSHIKNRFPGFRCNQLMFQKKNKVLPLMSMSMHGNAIQSSNEYVRSFQQIMECIHNESFDGDKS